MGTKQIALIGGGVVVVAIAAYIMFFQAVQLNFVIHGTATPFGTSDCEVAGEPFLLVEPQITIKDASGEVVHSETSEHIGDCDFRVEARVSKSDHYTVEVEGSNIGTYPRDHLADGEIYD